MPRPPLCCAGVGVFFVGAGGSRVGVLWWCIYNMGMTNFVDISVSKFGRRMRGVAVVAGERVKVHADRLADFGDAVVDVATEVVEAGLEDWGVRLVFEVSEELAEQVASVHAARAALDKALGERAEAVGLAAAALAEAGFTQNDAAGMLGVTRTAFRDFLNPVEGEPWGKSVLCSEPAAVASGAMVIGGWVPDEVGRLVVDKDFPVLIEGLGADVSRLWERAFGPFETPQEQDAAVEAETAAEGVSESVTDTEIDSDSDPVSEVPGESGDDFLTDDEAPAGL